MKAPLPCLGGWCGRRNGCKHYHSADRVTVPDERLCVPGIDGTLRETVARPRPTLADLIAEASEIGE